MRANIIFIAALERSGSTILDLILGTHRQIVSFGEVERVIKPHGADIKESLNRPCNCGEIVSNCPFWSIVIKRIIDNPDATDLSSRYHHFIQVFQEQYGDNTLAIDSSKNIRALNAIANTTKGKIIVLHTVRDVRSWTYSVRRAGSGKAEMPWSKVLSKDFNLHWKAFARHRILRLLPGWLMNEWAIRNYRIQYNIQTDNRLKCYNLSYEELALAPQKTLKALTNFLEVDDFKGELSVDSLESHIVRGNRAAFRKEILFPPRYDYEWLTSYKVLVNFTLLPYLRRLNNIWVYRLLNRTRNQS